MNDLRKTKAQLAAELVQLRNRVAELETAGAALQPIEMSLSHSRNLLLALSRAAQAVQRARTPDEIYRAVGEQIKALGFEATVCILDQTAGNLILKYTTYAPAIIRAGEKLAGISLQAYRMPLSPTSVYGRVLRTGQAEFTQSAHELVSGALPATLRPLAGPLVRMLKIDRGIVAPLRVDEEALGLLLMAASGVSPDDVPAMDSFAAQVAISLRNVRLAQQAQAELA
ncbi:MAG: GAF domain-containing protein, partial [Chloroflexi bacterium]|nr:GAF domain-containing protein [Chloroflexota bacterium]